MSAREAEKREWLLVKRDLYFRPDAQGYTGIRDNAGRYSEAEAREWTRDGDDGITMVHEVEAPEFTNACFDDLARDHLAAKNATLVAENEMLREALKEISDMFMARPDMVKAIQPLIGFGEKAIFDRAAAALAKEPAS